MDDETPQSATPIVEPASSEPAIESPMPAKEAEQSTTETPPIAEPPIIDEPVQAGPIPSEPNTESPTEPSQPISEPVPTEEQPPTIPVQPAPIATDQTQPNFIHGLLLKAQAKIQTNKQKKLDKLMLMAQKKGKITNEDAQKLLRISHATASRYLDALARDGRLTRSGNTNDLRYQFIR